MERVSRFVESRSLPLLFLKMLGIVGVFVQTIIFSNH